CLVCSTVQLQSRGYNKSRGNNLSTPISIYAEFCAILRPWLPIKRAFCRGMEHRSEPRRHESLVVTIKGMDNNGESFTQNVVATGLSNSGALLSGITRAMRSGDLLWVQHGDRKSRFKIVWVRNSETPQLIQAAIHLMKTESCPWAK